MGYVGLAATSVWIWRPSQVIVQEHYRTLVSQFENGAEQRRGKWARPIAQVQMRFDKPALTTDDIADIWRFYKAQQGNLYPFDLPLFGQLTAFAGAYSGGTSLVLADTQDLTTSATSRWNKIYTQNGGAGYDVFTITVVASGSVTVQSATGNLYAIGNPVSPVIKARFADDLYSPEYLPAFLASVGLTFTEVRS